MLHESSFITCSYLWLCEKDIFILAEGLIMVFSSLIFLWFFMPVVFAGYFLIKDKFKNIFLLLGSLFFYAWGEPKYIILMLFSIVINWGIGLLMDKYVQWKKLFLVASLVVNLGLLGYFKYYNFLVRNLNRFFGTGIEIQEVILPVGISFFTFQILSYIIDLYRGQYKAQKSIINLALYISFFPQLIAGPVVKYKDIDTQLSSRVQTIEKTSEGIRRFIYGLGKKVIISNVLAKYVDTVFAADYAQVTGVMAWLAAILYTLQIYYDFSGYSDMAIGLGKIFGFEFQENFNYPYLSRSIQEFWQRWHISLGTWFKEYLYIPLGGNRKGSIRTYINLVIVFFTTGLWHGAGFNFILWGLFHGFFQIIERLGLKKFLGRYKIIPRLYSMLVVVFGWVLFRANGLVQAGIMVKRMLLPYRYTESSIVMQEVFGKKTLFIFVIALAGCGLLQYILKKLHIDEKLKNSYFEILYCTLVFVMCIAMLASNTYNPFIYFRF